jgi:maleylpyruvate isomerase
MKLYTYFRSSAAYRVRIALALKGLDYEAVPVHLLRNGGEQLQDAYRAINPAALVPTFDDGEVSLGQSLAIIEYLDETRPQVPLLPADAAGRARVRALALTVAADTHPLGNLRVLKYLKGELQQGEDAKLAWQQHWLRTGMATLEALLAGDSRTGRFCHAWPIAASRRRCFQRSASASISRRIPRCCAYTMHARPCPPSSAPIHRNSRMRNKRCKNKFK